MSRRNIILLVVALLIAGITAFAMSAQLGNNQPPPVAEVQTPKNRVLIAKANISMGSFVRTVDQLEWRELKEGDIKAGVSYIREEDEALRSFEGAIARRSYRVGETVTSGTLIKPGSGGFLSAVLEPGRRAVSIAVNATSGNAGFIFPGDFVDVILVHRAQLENPFTGSENNYVFSNTFVQKARVLAVDQLLNNPENRAILAKTVTIEVTPKQAESVQVASEMGKVSFSLRSISDASTIESIELTRNGEFNEDFISALEQDPRGSDFTSNYEVSPALGSGEYNQNVRVLRGQESSGQNFVNPPPAPQ